jgi:hypothetical protein
MERSLATKNMTVSQWQKEEKMTEKKYLSVHG